ncbi:myosin heavy subunit [Bacillus tianshenii]|uniref:Myosin heavy subunit n=1 Tax=Sutcliffiella tianshenii TaxID=1463404 RepID=A0ABS2P0I9_9BACI|nr:TniB family NTP-binding protein [Bacillus tianshenii]MBM7620162.1 myosin heavy subunit [Bacillus tianshenii]
MQDKELMLDKMTMAEKMKLIKEIKIVHPHFNKALKSIKKCHDSLKLSNDPQCMLITGPSGSGKTTIFDTYIKLYDKTTYHERTGAQKSILWAEIPSPVRINSFLETMLDQLGDAYPTRGTVANKNHRLVNLIKDCGIELILLDEFQHFVHSENQKVNYEVADCFKSLVNRTKVPVVLFGLEDAKHVLQANEQLNRRFSMRLSLSPFGIETLQKREEIKKLLFMIDDRLPFKKLSGLNSDLMLEKLHLATDGLINSIMKLIREAALFALEKNQEKIELMDFARAYQMHAHIMRSGDKNPFLNEELNSSAS